MGMKKLKAKFRYAFGISLEEYTQMDNHTKIQLQSELTITDGYIGYMDVWNDTLRVYIFETSEERGRLLKCAKQIGFENVGLCEPSPMLISNVDCKRPHLKKMKSYSFYKEYYR